jgi:divalent metal cation (Fe/Co/Zn/Cd) transporter
MGMPMDAIEPHLYEQAEKTLNQNANVKAVERLRMRWVGHALHLDARLALDGDLTTTEIDTLIDTIGHDLYHAVPNLADTSISVAAWRADGARSERQSDHHGVPVVPLSK